MLQGVELALVAKMINPTGIVNNLAAQSRPPCIGAAGRRHTALAQQVGAPGRRHTPFQRVMLMAVSLISPATMRKLRRRGGSYFRLTMA
ncbi:MAG: hypothetical protein EBW27_06830 [Acidimicrobiia bacterium]|nr:hypothetical protein [Acidimicrobiia bacterium]NCZ56432.1 hypothetical protein [Acidimicrobiia bacterium]